MSNYLKIKKMYIYIASQVAQVVKVSACQFRRCKRQEFYPWVGKIPWRSK